MAVTCGIGSLHFCVAESFFLTMLWVWVSITTVRKSDGEEKKW